MSSLNPFNQFSFVLIAGAALLMLAAFIVVSGLNRRKAVAWLVAAAAFGAAWLSLRTGSSDFQEAAQAELVIRTADRPVLVEFYSDYCAGCLAARPTLDTLERELKDDLQVIRLDVASSAGRELGGQLGLRVTPTFILFDIQGHEVWRSLGSLDASAVLSALGKT
jgi:thiol-disulfide isomerase/thioredoxin